ncbi:MAG: type II toxin-antitoxin system VapC family toxin [Deltaproteobacteria bacterium]|nr:MAG: type II toxin-antitoxin system VapC family toxin [Deltaproteobacteria bacterium]
MVLVDTSVWIEHLRFGHAGLEPLLNAGEVICHPFVIGELACGTLKNRKTILSLLKALPSAVEADHAEVMDFLEKNLLMGRGLGLIDVHLIASALLSGVQLWTLDKKLRQASSKLGIAY